MLYFLVNPASGSNRGKELWNQVEEYLKSEKIEYEVLFSVKPGHVAELARSLTMEHCKENIRLIVLGGDGTLDEALQGIVNFDMVEIGYIPTGSGNDFARALNLNESAVERVKNILSVETPSIYDLGKLEYLNMTEERSRLFSGNVSKERLFDVSCGMGFDAGICEGALKSKAKDALNKIGLGKLIYLFIAIRLIFGDKKPDATLILDGEEEVKIKKLRFAVGMNTCFEGGGYKFAPSAVPDDGYLDVCVVNNVSAIGAFGVLPKAAKGNHVKSKKVHLYHVKSFELKTDIPLWVHTDGEVYTKSSHIRVSVLPRKMKFLI